MEKKQTVGEEKHLYDPNEVEVIELSSEEEDDKIEDPSSF
jgi:hypothetical protein